MDNDAKEILTIENHENELSERSLEIDTKNQAKLMKEIVSAVKATMRKNDLVSLAAPSIGYPRRILAIKFPLEIKTFINPIIVKAEGMTLSRENSVTIPNRTFLMPRNNKIWIMYQRPTGQPESVELDGKAAVIFQKELNALDGILISDIGLEIFDDFDSASDEEKEEIINAYLDSLDLRRKEINEEIQNNEELKQMDDAIHFMESVYKGETKLDLENSNKTKEAE